MDYEFAEGVIVYIFTRRFFEKNVPPETTAITYCEIPSLSNPDSYFSNPFFFRAPLLPGNCHLCLT